MEVERPRRGPASLRSFERSAWLYSGLAVPFFRPLQPWWRKWWTSSMLRWPLPVAPRAYDTQRVATGWKCEPTCTGYRIRMHVGEKGRGEGEMRER